MLKGGSAVCLLSALVLALARHPEDLLNIPAQPSPSPDPSDSVLPPQIQVPLDRLMLKDNGYVAYIFGFRLLEELRAIHTNCEITRNQEELEFNTQVGGLMEYYERAGDLVSNENFDALSLTNRNSLQKNFEDAFVTAEQVRNDKLRDIQDACDRDMDEKLSAAKSTALGYVYYLVRENHPSDFTLFMFRVEEYKEQVVFGLANCQSYYTTLEHQPNNAGIGEPYDLCYGKEIDILVAFINRFIAEAESFAREYYQSDDEDYSIGDEESGDYSYYTDDPPPAPGKVGEEDNGEDDDGKIITLPAPAGEGRPTDEIPATVNTLTTRMSTEADPTSFEPMTEETPEKSTSNEGGTVATDEDKEEEIADDFFNALEPGPVILPPAEGPSTPPPPPPSSSPTSHPPETGPEYTTTEYVGHLTTETIEPTEEWPKDAFDEVIEEVKEEEERERSQGDRDETGISDSLSHQRSGSSKSSKSSSSSSEDSDDQDSNGEGFEGDVHINIPGFGDVDVAVEEEEGGEVSFQAGFSDDEEGGVVIDPPEEEDEEEDDSSFVGYFFTYFFVTVGVLVVLAVIMLTLGVVISRRRAHQGYSPLLTEDEKITVMKQTGYINPTYKFFDQATSI